VRKHHPEISVIALGENCGFATVVNTGIRASESEYLALLNNDTAVDSDWLEAPTQALN
jgi:GT2 family glycosyltransferase